MEISYRISLLKFLGYPGKLPDRNAIRYFREHLFKIGKDFPVFSQIKEHVKSKHIRIKKGMMQDASLIVTDRV